MIESALVSIRDVLNETFKREFSITENKIVLSNLMDPDGNMPPDTDGKIVFFLVKLGEEAAMKNHLNRSSDQFSGTITERKPNIHLNLHLFFCANFSGKNYVEGLSYLSALIKFFRNNNQLQTGSNTSSGSARMYFDLCQLDFSELSHLWSAIGSKMMPGVMYKMRVVTLDDANIKQVIPVIKQTKNTANDT